MIDRRILLASVAGLAGIAGLRWLRAAPAQATEKFEIEKTDAEWRAQLTPEQYQILRQQGTEPPFTSPLLKEHRKGIFACAGCDLPLFSSETKFESGTGWPSFYQPLENAVGKTSGPYARHGAHRNSLPPLRRPSRSRVRRRSEADRPALLHGRPGVAVSSSGRVGDLNRSGGSARARQYLPARQLCPGLWTGAFLFKRLK